MRLEECIGQISANHNIGIFELVGYGSKQVGVAEVEARSDAVDAVGDGRSVVVLGPLNEF
jgi:hypothetical protein